MGLVSKKLTFLRNKCQTLEMKDKNKETTKARKKVSQSKYRREERNKKNKDLSVNHLQPNHFVLQCKSLFSINGISNTALFKQVQTNIKSSYNNQASTSYHNESRKSIRNVLANRRNSLRKKLGAEDNFADTLSKL